MHCRLDFDPEWLAISRVAETKLSREARVTRAIIPPYTEQDMEAVLEALNAAVGVRGAGPAMRGRQRRFECSSQCRWCFT